MSSRSKTNTNFLSPKRDAAAIRCLWPEAKSNRQLPQSTLDELSKVISRNRSGSNCPIKVFNYRDHYYC